jgi:hypothetical protein
MNRLLPSLGRKRLAVDCADGVRNSSVVTIQLPARRVVLLGASNLTRSFATVVSVARSTWGEPVEVMAALGHGRSYGQDSTVLGRKIPGIFPCALWRDLEHRAALPTAALMTDIGNDLLYGVPPKQILKWVAQCLDRLAAAGASTIITQLPLSSVERLGEARFRLFRSVLFPRSRLTLSGAKDLVRELNQELIALGQSRKMPVISMENAWYGFDPIHVRRRAWRQAWPAILAPWHAAGSAIVVPRMSLRTSAYLAMLPPSERSLFGVKRRAVQPSGRLSDGSTISLY